MDGKEDKIIYNGIINDLVYHDDKVYFVDSTGQSRHLTAKEEQIDNNLPSVSPTPTTATTTGKNRKQVTKP